MIAISVVALGIFIFFPTLAEEFTAGLRPSLFYAPLPQDVIAADLEQEYEQVFGVAHNSGDSVPATLAALASGADAIEIDVVSLDGALYSSHAPPLPWIGSSVFRGPSLEAVWTAAAQTDLVKFDLKESTPEFLELVLGFLATHKQDHQVVIATDDPASLRFFADRMPDVLRFFSVGDREELTSLREDPDLVALIDGVSIQEALVDEETAGWLNERDLRVLVWIVNDLGRANDLVRLGVDAITTDNLALMGLLGGQRREESTLEPAGATTESGDAGLGTARRTPATTAVATMTRSQVPTSSGRSKTARDCLPGDGA